VVVEIEIPFLGALLACFLRECDQEGLRIRVRIWVYSLFSN